MINSTIQIIFAVLALGLIIAWHEFGHFIVARLTGMKVLQFSIGFGPKLIGFIRNGIQYRLGILPIGGYVQIAGMTDLEEDAKDDPKSFINRPYWAQVATIAAGPIFNYFLAFVLFIFVFWSVSPSNSPGILLGTVAPDSAAQAAGIQNGDVLLRMDSVQVTNVEDFLANIKNSNGKPISLEIRRGNDILTLSASPIADAQGKYRLGVGGSFPVDLGFLDAVKQSASTLWNLSAQTLTMIGDALTLLFSNIFNKIVSGSEGGIFEGIGMQLGGPLQITRDLSQSAVLGFKNLFGMLASLSLVLGLFNILPIPALDGSKILFLSLEKIIGRKIPSGIQIAIHLSGIIFILGLMLILTVFDVLRLYSAS